MYLNNDRISNNMSNTVHNDNISPFNVTKSGLTLVHLNIQHILPKIDEIKHTLANCKNVINVIGFSETFLGESHLNTEIHINGYNCVRRDRPNGKGGGLLVYVQESLDFIHRPDLQKAQIEAIWIEVVLKRSKNLLVGMVYRPQNSLLEWYNLFESMVNSVSMSKLPEIVLGDFNVDLLSVNMSHLLSEMMTCFGLSQVINEPTRITSDTATIIDHISDVEMVSETAVGSLSLSDHQPIGVVWSKPYHKIRNGQHKTIKYRKFSHIDPQSFSHDLSCSLNCISDTLNMNEKLKTLSNCVNNCLNIHAPLLEKRIKRQHQPKWFSEDIQNAINVRDNCKTSGQFSEYKKARNNVTKLIKLAKQAHYQNIVSQANGDSCKLWKCINELKGKGLKTSVQMILSNGECLTNQSENANYFGEHYANMAKKVISDQNWSHDHKYVPNNVLLEFISTRLPPDTEFDLPQITIFEVKKHIGTMSCSKSTGLDGLSPVILKKFV